LPNGNAIVIMKPESHPDGSFSLTSTGEGFGDPGFYFVVHARDGMASFVVLTWQICLRRIERFRRFRVFLPQEVRSFAEGVAVILDAYLSGELTYTVLTARR